jgi:hypothetical protein
MNLTSTLALAIGAVVGLTLGGRHYILINEA